MILMIIAVWLALSAGFIAGAIWASRKPEPPAPKPVPFTAARQTPVRLWREDWERVVHEQARADLLAMMERGKW